MAQTSVENKICSACGADVRPQALFCYNCGSNVIAEKSLSADNGSADILVQKTMREEKIEKIPFEAEKIPVAKKSEKLTERNVQEQTKLKTAAALRRKSKSFQPKIVEVVWEEHENAPNIWFISVSIVLAVLAIAILLLAIYLK